MDIQIAQPQGSLNTPAERFDSPTSATGETSGVDSPSASESEGGRLHAAPEPEDFDDDAIAPVAWVTNERGRVLAIDIKLPSGEVVEMLPDSLTSPGATNVRQSLLQWSTYYLLRVKNLSALRIRILNELAGVKAVRVSQRALPDGLHSTFLDRLYARAMGVRYEIPCRAARKNKKQPEGSSDEVI